MTKMMNYNNTTTVGTLRKGATGPAFRFKGFWGNFHIEYPNSLGDFNEFFSFLKKEHGCAEVGVTLDTNPDMRYVIRFNGTDFEIIDNTGSVIFKDRFSKVEEGEDA